MLLIIRLYKDKNVMRDQSSSEKSRLAYQLGFGAACIFLGGPHPKPPPMQKWMNLIEVFHGLYHGMNLSSISKLDFCARIKGRMIYNKSRNF